MFEFKTVAVSHLMSGSTSPTVVEFAIVQSGTWRNEGCGVWARVHNNQLSIEGLRRPLHSGPLKLTTLHPYTLKQLRTYGWMLNDPLAYRKPDDSHLRLTVQMPPVDDV